MEQRLDTSFILKILEHLFQQSTLAEKKKTKFEKCETHFYNSKMKKIEIDTKFRIKKIVGPKF